MKMEHELEALYKKFKPRHLKTFRRVLYSPDEAEDVFQEAMTRVVKYYPTYNHKLSPIDVWFCKIVFNELSRHIRKKKREHTVFCILDLAAELIPDEVRTDFRYIIEDMIEVLPEEDDKCILRLHYLSGHSTDEIASLLKTSKDRVRYVCRKFKTVYMEE